MGASVIGLSVNAASANPISAKPGASVADMAGDEAFWARIAAEYDVTDEVVPLENGNWGMMARSVLADYHANIGMVNRRNSFYARREYWKDLGGVRQRVAGALGVLPEEIVFTRNATEALQALITGYRRLKPADGVLYADLDYGSMQTAMDWLSERRGVTVNRLDVPEPATKEAVLAAYADAFRRYPETKLLLLTHLSHRTGLVPPVKEIAALATAHGIDIILDSAHAWGQIEFNVADLGIPFIGFNLHKWIGAPLGVGAMYVRRDRIDDIAPFLNEAESPDDPILARVHSGTADFAAYLTVPGALDFQDQIGLPAKAARLRYLRNRWVQRFRDHPKVDILTPDEIGSYGAITSFRFKRNATPEGNRAVAAALLERFGIFTVHRTGPAGGACVRITPALFNSAAQVDQLVDALTVLAREY